MLWIIHHWWLPLLCAFIWWGMLIALMVCWAVQGKPIYEFMLTSKDDADHHQTILYISDIAATNLQPIFIACSGAQGICFVLSLVAERWLRHQGRLQPNWNKTEKVLSGFAIAFAIIGQLGILFVSIFNTHVFPHVHIAMLCVFIVGVGISCLFTISEYALLDKNYSGIRRIRISYILKGIWFLIALGLAVAFAVLSGHDKGNAAAICEWTISFFYGLYLALFAYDLAPAQKVKKGELLGHQLANHLDVWRSNTTNADLTEQPPMNTDESLENSPIGEHVLKERDAGFHF